ncbi:MAG: hypothetical protein WCX82_00240 [archaeon]|jgi:hypothetical protein
MPELHYNKTKELTRGLFISFKKSIISLTFGAFISLLSTVFLRFLEIAFGFAWKNGLTYLFLSYGYLIATTAQSVYYSFKGYLKEGIFYIVGWGLGSLLLFRFGAIDKATLFNSLLIPGIIICIKLFYTIVKSSNKTPVKHFRRYER